VIVAPTKILGTLRRALHAEVVGRIAAEIPKELWSHPVAEIERLIAAQNAISSLRIVIPLYLLAWA
jgi:protein required for attachment to host cells